jgi:peptidoglycan/LPS O-acetylase OafA/YrhL
MRTTFGTILKDHNDVGPGFDLLRLGLAVAILVAHCSAVGGTRGIVPSAIEIFMKLVGQAHAEDIGLMAGFHESIKQGIPWMRPIVVSHVPMFFALSGFLVTGSAFRTKRVLPFLGLRFFRIFPALCVEVALSAVVIGALFTSLPLREYFMSRGFFIYFGNILGIVQMHLPGVTFGDNDVVNANLWTLPSEFHCYLILAILIVTGIAFNRMILTTLFAASTVALLVANVFFDFNTEPYILTGNINVYYFFAGAMFFHWRDRIPYSRWLLVPSTVIAYALLFTTHAVYIIPPLVTYVTVYIGLTSFQTNRLLQSGDYSYGIYLYGYPISEALVATFPVLRGNFFGLTASAIICTGLFAFLSWHLVEKRFLRLRKYFSTKSAKIAEELHPEAHSVSQPAQLAPNAKV